VSRECRKTVKLQSLFEKVVNEIYEITGIDIFTTLVTQTAYKHPTFLT